MYKYQHNNTEQSYILMQLNMYCLVSTHFFNIYIIYLALCTIHNGLEYLYFLFAVVLMAVRKIKIMSKYEKKVTKGSTANNNLHTIITQI